ncbi:hypothetical protein LU699_02720 [Luteimonas fraxinea]|uniref:hypothetical protein n=1 Tax=Luteimonas fraxinea TaxID=2901869 RepID=UPI001E4316CF|nr:hypothetical protein [Luteimonas fraxinea]UHH10668.1 hypothetical protein LU699_02720 [Luteimonas fraxinea]
MSHRAWWLVIATIVLLGIAVAVQEGLRRNADDVSSPDAPGATAPDSSDASPAAAIAAGNAELRAAHDTAMQDAVSAVHAYLAALFKDDRSEADALWIHGRPASQGEADLRTLEDVPGLRVDNERPQPLDATPVPTALRIPVHLRIGGQGPLRRYSGYYDLRRDGETWRITAASIDPSPAQR